MGLLHFWQKCLTLISLKRGQSIKMENSQETIYNRVPYLQDSLESVDKKCVCQSLTVVTNRIHS